MLKSVVVSLVILVVSDERYQAPVLTQYSNKRETIVVKVLTSTAEILTAMLPTTKLRNV